MVGFVSVEFSTQEQSQYRILKEKLSNPKVITNTLPRLNLEETKDNFNMEDIEVEKPVEREKLDELLLI